MAAWSDLTQDVLAHITRFLPLPDVYRFGAICKNCRSVSKLRWHPPAPVLPWLVLEEDSETKKRKFYSLSEDKHYSIEIPELQGRFICGSSYGWLFAVDINITGILINPFTRECYELPPFPSYNEKSNVTTLLEKIPCDYIDGPRGYTFEEMQTLIVFKAILSHDPRERSDFTAMILFGEINTPAFWRPGESSWTVVDGLKYRMEDVLYFKGNFYVISAMNVLYVVEFEPELKLTEVGPRIGKEGCPEQRYLMDFNGNLLFIERYCEDVEGRAITVGFNVIEPNLEENRLYEWFDIDDYALFLGRNSSIFVDSSHVAKCKKNGIYFTDVIDGFSKRCQDLGIFDMTDKTISAFYSVEVFPPRIGSPIWLTPILW